MPECQCLQICPYFQTVLMKEMDSVAKMRKEEYCKGDYFKCARFMVFQALGANNVPGDLLPFQVQQAKKLIKTRKKQN